MRGFTTYSNRGRPLVDILISCRMRASTSCFEGSLDLAGVPKPFERPAEIVGGTWRAARAEQDDVTEDEARDALTQLDPLWDELFPAEQARIVQLLVDRVDVLTHGVEVRLRPNGLAGLVREVTGRRRAAA